MIGIIIVAHHKEVEKVNECPTFEMKIRLEGNGEIMFIHLT
jgi:hypothetical protein